MTSHGRRPPSGGDRVKLADAHQRLLKCLRRLVVVVGIFSTTTLTCPGIDI